MTAPTFVSAAVFSGMERVAVGTANTGALLAEVLPLPEADQGLSPSALVARTCTSYAVFMVRPVIVAVVPVWFCGPLVKLPLSPTRYRRS